MVKIICIEGQKGAGKSTLIKALKESEKNIIISAPFRDSIDLFQKEFPMCQTTFDLSQDKKGAKIVTKILIEHISNIIKNNQDKDFIIFDRGWLTGMCTIIGSVLSDEEKKEQIKVWEKHIMPTIFMDTNIETILERRSEMLDISSGLDDINKLEFDLILRRNLIKKYEKCLLTTYFSKPLLDKEIKKDVSLKVMEIKQISRSI